ncbi:hypothetical protein JX265_011757 [Neoarthrinium moseri]|uniref:Uncharacterized protein n=1 Tax=Neoarthrinium moseri TaxID=1658444 RepID=A0A9P9WC17_9PEZI|nr:hypothetical protein JX265_011757 [Neoarthrinium moseri]
MHQKTSGQGFPHPIAPNGGIIFAPPLLLRALGGAYQHPSNVGPSHTSSFDERFTCSKRLQRRVLRSATIESAIYHHVGDTEARAYAKSREITESVTIKYKVQSRTSQWSGIKQCGPTLGVIGSTTSVAIAVVAHAVRLHAECFTIATGTQPWPPWQLVDGGSASCYSLSSEDRSWIPFALSGALQVVDIRAEAHDAVFYKL